MGSLFRKLFSLALIALVAHFFWRVSPVVLNYFEFKDQVTETARFSRGRAAEDVQREVLALAQRSHIPLEEPSLKVQQYGDRIHVEAAYVENLQVLPRYFYPYEFTIEIDTTVARPVTPDQVR